MDDFSIYGDSFDQSSSPRVSSAEMQGEESNSKLGEMSLHGETGDVLGHEISTRRIEVDKTKKRSDC